MSLIAELHSKAQSRVMSQNSSVSYEMLGGKLIPIADNAANYVQKGYGINDVIYSIINMIMEKIRLAPWSLYEVIDESSLKSYHAITRKQDISAEEWRKARVLHTKALKPVKYPGQWGTLLSEPHENITWQDFVAAGSGFKMLTGNKFIWANLIDKGADTGKPASLWLMPSQYMQILASTGFPCKVLGYQMPIEVKDKPNYGVEEVLHEKYYNFDYSVNGSHLMGMAPLKAGLRLTNRNNSALDVSTAKFQNGGLETVLYLDEANVDKGEGMKSMKALKQKLITEYTGPLNYGKIAASGYKVGALNLGLSPVELNIIEAEKWDLRRFCNLLGGVPSQLLNDPENKTYNNQKEGEKALTSRCALSHLTSTRDSLNMKGHKYWGLKPNQILDYDMTVFPELQEDLGEKMKWVQPLANMTGLSPNAVLDLMGLEKITDPLFDQPWIRPQMGQPKSEWDMSEVDETLNDEPAD